jgi:hypothetical protein
VVKNLDAARLSDAQRLTMGPGSPTMGRRQRSEDCCRRRCCCCCCCWLRGEQKRASFCASLCYVAARCWWRGREGRGGGAFDAFQESRSLLPASKLTADPPAFAAAACLPAGTVPLKTSRIHLPSRHNFVLCVCSLCMGPRARSK